MFRILGEILWDDRVIELVCFLPALRDTEIKIFSKGRYRTVFRIFPIRQPQPHGDRLSRLDRECIVRRCLGSCPLGIYGLLLAGHDVLVDPVLDVRSAILDAEQPLQIGFVFGKEQLWRAFAMQPAPSLVRVVEFDHWICFGLSGLAQNRTLVNLVTVP